MIFGKGSWLIAGYNTASKKEKEKYDEKKLCRAVGIYCLAAGILLSFPAYFIYEVQRGTAAVIVYTNKCCKK